MSLRACPDCGRRISTKAERCPNCGWSPSRPNAESVPLPFLLSAAEVRRRKVKCRECGDDVSLGSGSCPSCGYTPGAGRPAGWKILLGLVVLIAIGVAGVAWQLGLLPRRHLSAASLGTMVADSTALEGELRQTSGLRRRRDPPRIRSSRFQASCLSPAPVLVYALDRMPIAYFVRLTPGSGNPTLAGDSLRSRYQLVTNGYEARWNALYVKEATPDLVAKLRCDPAVGSIEEVAFNDDDEVRLPRMTNMKRFRS
jgi:RNA polymerase subunit RPABC4/transcription elongation factor Spt4